MRELPVISKTAERRVRDRLPIPTSCPHCHGVVVFANNAEVYGRAYGDWPWLYLCQNAQCRAYVGTHPNTALPLGTLATADIRLARKKAKEPFDRLWQSGQMSRTNAYSWLAGKLGIPVAACHFGWFDAEQCAVALAVLTEALQPVERSAQATKAVAELRALLAAKTSR